MSLKTKIAQKLKAKLKRAIKKLGRRSRVKDEKLEEHEFVPMPMPQVLLEPFSCMVPPALNSFCFPPTERSLSTPALGIQVANPPSVPSHKSDMDLPAIEHRLRRLSISIPDHHFNKKDIDQIHSDNPAELVVALNVELPLNANTAAAIKLMDEYASKTKRLHSIRITMKDNVSLPYKTVRQYLDAISEVWPTLTAKVQTCWVFFGCAGYRHDIEHKGFYFDQMEADLNAMEKERCARLEIKDWAVNHDGLKRCWVPPAPVRHRRGLLAGQSMELNG